MEVKWSKYPNHKSELVRHLNIDNSKIQVGRHNRDIFSIFFNMKVFCVFSLESPRRGDSNEYTQYTIFNIKRKIDLNYLKSAAMGFFPRDSSTNSKHLLWNAIAVLCCLKALLHVTIYNILWFLYYIMRF